MADLLNVLVKSSGGMRLENPHAVELTRVDALMQAAADLSRQGHGKVISYSRKVFIPLTRLCRDVCHYCTFAKSPRQISSAYLSPEEILDIARAGSKAGCTEALFTLGDRPELRYRVAREALDSMGYRSTIGYLEAMAERVLKETGLLPHVNPGVMTRAELAALRRVSVSQGLMLESASPRLCRRGGPHYGSPDKAPAVRLACIGAAGELRIPFTSGILIGIGETRAERIESLLALRELNDRYGHLQEVIIQSFRAKPGTVMAGAAEPTLEELLWTIAVARLLFGSAMNIQAPPNLSPGMLGRLIAAGINDWGGVSPVTPDYVNPEAPWPHLSTLENATAAAGAVLTPRLPIYPEWVRVPERWLDPALQGAVWKTTDGEGYARADDWSAGATSVPPDLAPGPRRKRVLRKEPVLVNIVERALQGQRPSEADVAQLFQVRGDDFAFVCDEADALRRAVNGDTVTYIVNRNINYTNVCYFKCRFCAFSKGSLSAELRGPAYELEFDEIARRVREAWDRGATEVCMQGGIHPDYTGDTYLDICRTVKAAVPGMHIHAFSPLEIWQGAATAGLSIHEFLGDLREAGLGTLPGTAAEVLDDEVRAVICPDKINTRQWLEVMETAHDLGFRTTATIMFGHVDGPSNWARHLLRLRDLQARTGGFTEFVPLPFVHMEAPLYLKGRARKGPTFREAVLMHAVGRLVLHPYITNIQTSWVKMGHAGAAACLRAGANDLGGTLMNESITRAAGAAHGQETPPSQMEALIAQAARIPKQRTTLYADADVERIMASFSAVSLAPVVNSPVRRILRTGRHASGPVRAESRVTQRE